MREIYQKFYYCTQTRNIGDIEAIRDGFLGKGAHGLDGAVGIWTWSSKDR